MNQTVDLFALIVVSKLLPCGTHADGFKQEALETRVQKSSRVSAVQCIVSVCAMTSIRPMPDEYKASPPCGNAWPTSFLPSGPNYKQSVYRIIPTSCDSFWAMSIHRLLQVARRHTPTIGTTSLSNPPTVELRSNPKPREVYGGPEAFWIGYIHLLETHLRSGQVEWR